MVSFLYDNDFKHRTLNFQVKVFLLPRVVAGTLNAAVTEGITSGLILL